MKYCNIPQHNEEDCGAACLATIAKHYGRTFTLNHVREAVGTGQLGTTLLGLIRGAEALGFNARGVKADPAILNWLEDLPLPAILHWQGNHYVVFYGKRGRMCVVADPAIGVRYLTQEELLQGWTTGVMLLLELDPGRFFAQEDAPIRGLERFVQSIWCHRNLLLEALLINLVLGALSLSLPFLIQILTDDVLIRGDTDLLTRIASVIIIMQLMSGGLDLIQYTLIAHFAQRLHLELVLEFGRKLLRLPLTYYESHRSGEVTSRLKDIEEINQLISQMVVGLPSLLFIAIVSLGLMIFYSSRLAIVAVAISGVMTLSTMLLLPLLKQRVRRLLILEAENQGVLVETFKGALTVKTTTATPQLWQEFQSRFSHLANIEFQTTQINILNRTFSHVVLNIGDIVLLWVGSSFVIRHELTIGQLLAFNVLNDHFLAFITFTVRFISDYVRASTAIQRLSEVIDSTPEVDNHPLKHWVTLPANAEITCVNLSFYYPGRPDLLQAVDLIIPGGQVTALIGASGCGKSTLSKLMAGLHTPKTGNIRLNHYNLQDLSLDCLRQQVVLVPQEAHFWSRSIVENFRLGAPYTPFEAIVRACKIAEADEFISQLPDKYQTVLGEFGVNLSGGQRQRLAIARAIVTDPPILILDESTANLDSNREARVLDQLLHHRQGQTTILISHRPSVIQRADWIVVLEQGHVLLQGARQQLLQQSGTHLDLMS